MADTKDFKAVNGQLEVTKTEQVVGVATYDYKQLVQQLENIQSQQDRDNAQRELEKAEVLEYIQAAKGLNLEVAAEVTPVVVI